MTTEGAAASCERGVVNADHPMLAGHFPGHPIVPGAWLLAWVVAAAAHRLSGEARAVAAVKRVKFLRPLAPQHPFECAFSSAARPDSLRFTVVSGGEVIAEGALQLQQRVN